MVKRVEAAGLLESELWHAMECLDCDWTIRWRTEPQAQDAADLHQAAIGHDQFVYSTTDKLPPPAEPVIGEPALTDARAWCRWCGHRVAMKGDRWQHNATDSPPGNWITVDCEGPEPWPSDFGDNA